MVLGGGSEPNEIFTRSRYESGFALQNLVDDPPECRAHHHDGHHSQEPIVLLRRLRRAGPLPAANAKILEQEEPAAGANLMGDVLVVCGLKGFFLHA